MKNYFVNTKVNCNTLKLRLDTVLPCMCVTIRNFMHGLLLLSSLKKQRELIQEPINVNPRTLGIVCRNIYMKMMCMTRYRIVCSINRFRVTSRGHYDVRVTLIY